VDFRVADLRSAGEIEALVSHAVDRFGGIDVLVNNTGGPPACTFEDLDDGAWQGAFEQILMSLIRCVRGVLPIMRERGGGKIVNVASSSVKQPIEAFTLSNTFRAALAGLAKTLSIELTPDGILVNTLGPGRIATARSQGMDTSEVESRGVAVEEVRAGSRRGYLWAATGRPGSSRGWPPSSPRRPTPEYRSTKRSELKFHALLADDSQEVRFDTR
jgi:3-oxoacyl-[acyl-carrier protein] reductase